MANGSEDQDDLDFNSDEDSNVDLLRDRRANDKRLKGRLEHIFEKYSRDFSTIGDEIDIETGEILLDNGHVRGMQHETDLGQIEGSLGLVGGFATQEAECCLEAKDLERDAMQKLDDSIGSQPTGLDNRKRKVDSRLTAELTAEDLTRNYSELPACKRRQEDGTQALPRLNPVSFSLSPLPSQGEIRQSLWTPVNPPKPARRKCPQDGARDVKVLPSVLHRDDPDSQGAADARDNAAVSDLLLRECAHCYIKATTAWRRGPDGTFLCNACGMYWYRHDHMRPLRSLVAEQASVHEAAVGDEPYQAGLSHTLSTPKYRNGSFTTEEDALIIKLKEIDQLPWERIGHFFPGRSYYGVQCRYSKKLSNQICEGRTALVNQGFNFIQHAKIGVAQSSNKGQDQSPVQLHEEHDPSCRAVVDQLPDDFPGPPKYPSNTMLAVVTEAPRPRRRKPLKAPQHHQKTYSKEEDERLIRLREIDKLPWEILAQEFPQRTWLALQKRYVRTLARRHQAMCDGGDDPYTHLFLERDDEDSVQMGPAGRQSMSNVLKQRREEDVALMKMKDDDGLTFEEIAGVLPGRTAESLAVRHAHVTEVSGMMNMRTPTSPHVVMEQVHTARAEDVVPKRLNGGLVSTADAETMTFATDPALMGPSCSASSILVGEHSTSSAFEMETRHHDVLHPTESDDFFKAAQSSPSFVAKTLLASHMMATDGPVTPRAVTTSLTPLVAEKEYNEAEHNRIAELRNSNLDWESIAAEAPGRTAASIASYWAQHCKDKALQSITPINPKPRARSSNTLLRQALYHGAKGKADGGKRMMGTPDLSANTHSSPMNLFTTFLRSAPDICEPTNTDDVVFDLAKLAAPSQGSSPQVSPSSTNVADEGIGCAVAMLSQGLVSCSQVAHRRTSGCTSTLRSSPLAYIAPNGMPMSPAPGASGPTLTVSNDTAKLPGHGDNSEDANDANSVRKDNEPEPWQTRTESSALGSLSMSTDPLIQALATPSPVCHNKTIYFGQWTRGFGATRNADIDYAPESSSPRAQDEMDDLTVTSSPTTDERGSSIIHNSPLTDQAGYQVILSALDCLRPYLPYSLPLYRRLQFGRFFETSCIISNLHRDDIRVAGLDLDEGNVLSGRNDVLQRPWVMAFVDRGCRPETEAWVFGTWEVPDGAGSAGLAGKDEGVAALMAGVVKACKALPISVSIHQGQTTHHSMVNTTGSTLSDYASHASNPNIMLAGAIHERTIPYLQALGVVPTEYKTSLEPNHTFVFDVATMPAPPPLPKGLYWGEPRPEHFALVRSRTAIPRQERTMMLLPRLAIFSSDNENNTTTASQSLGPAPIAWAFVGLDGSLTTLHVESAWRRHGLAKSLTTKLFREFMDGFWEKDSTEKKWAHGYVMVGNEASAGMCRSLGGRSRWECFWVRIDLSAVDKTDPHLG
ncbi:hypothetical protein LTR62_006556 [Meristemomyces frigidus]|uniref:Uncharacterized protein n=1 Tax=Meristemomyces frigidus TaxID=1508187 RepID=A0AAN7TBK5_9PEZI|nr:hypothetical protein LTR62_006556 [Meristemomyces frigidus]